MSRPPDDNGSTPGLVGSSLGAEALAEIAFNQLVRVLPGGDEDKITLAIDALVRALSALPADHSLIGKYMSILSNAYFVSFQRTNALSDLYASIDWGERAVSAIPTDHAGQPIALHMLADSYLRRFEYTAEPADLDMSIKNGELARSVFEYEGRGTVLANLAEAYWLRYMRNYESNDLRLSIDRGEEALSARPTDAPRRRWILGRLGFAYMAQFRIDGQAATIQCGIDSIEAALSEIAVTDSAQLDLLWLITPAYLMLFESTGKAEDLKQVVNRATQFLDRATAEHSKRSRAMHLARVVAILLGDESPKNTRKIAIAQIRAKDLLLEVNDRRGAVEDLAQLAVGLSRAGRLNEAREVILRAAVVAIDVGDSALVFHALKTLFDLPRIVRVDQLLLIYNRINTSLREHDNKIATAIALNDLGVRFRENNQLSHSIRVHYWAAKLAREVGSLKIEANSLTSQGIALKSLGKLRTAIYVLVEGANIAGKAAELEVEAMALYELGDTLSRVKSWRQERARGEAIDAYTRAAALYAEAGDVRGEFGALNNLGTVLGSIKRYDDAVRTLRRAANVARSNGDHGLEAGALWNAHTFLNAAGRAEDAARARAQAEAAIEKTRS